MLACIDNFFFDIDNTSFDSFETSFTYEFAKTKRLGNFDHFQDVGKYEESINIKGLLLAKSQSQLSDFEVMANEKKERILILADGRCKSILILALKKNSSSFLKDGAFLKQEYSIELAVVGDGKYHEAS